jgi:hypothetical protein
MLQRLSELIREVAGCIYKYYAFVVYLYGKDPEEEKELDKEKCKLKGRIQKKVRLILGMDYCYNKEVCR